MGNSAVSLGCFSYHECARLGGSIAMPVSACLLSSQEIVATYVPHDLELDAGQPAQEWKSANPIAFCADWQGKNADPSRETQVHILWSEQNLYLRFECRFCELFLFADSAPDGRRDQLWDRDVVEAFFQPDPAREGHYKEFEVSPNGMWIDLDIFPGGRSDLKSGMRRSVVLDQGAKTWSAEVAIPIRAVTASFDPSLIWRANFYRVEGKQEPRAYLAWQPTLTPQPNFHVPARFGSLRFSGENSARQ
jgi:alpha-galactosidase